VNSRGAWGAVAFAETQRCICIYYDFMLWCEDYHSKCAVVITYKIRRLFIILKFALVAVPLSAEIGGNTVTCSLRRASVNS
jgi:hypothetical protein